MKIDPETSNVNQASSWQRLDQSSEKLPMPMTAPKAWQKHLVDTQTRGNIFFSNLNGLSC